MSNNKIGIVLGASSLYLGLGQQSECKCIPAYYGKPKVMNPMLKQLFYGEQAIAKRPILKLNRLIEENKIVDEQMFKNLIKEIIVNELKIKQSEFKNYEVYFVTTSLNPESIDTLKNIAADLQFNNTTILDSAQIIAEKYKQMQSFLLLEVGDEVTRCSIVVNQQLINEQTLLGDMAGKQLTEYVQMLLLEEAKVVIEGQEEQQPLKQEEISLFLADNIKKQLISNETQQYELPDGRIIYLGDTLKRYKQVLHDPQIIGKHKGTQQLIDQGSQIIKQLTGDQSVKLCLAGCSSIDILKLELLNGNNQSITIMNGKDNLKFVTWIALQEHMK